MLNRLIIAHNGLALFAFVPSNINGERMVVQHLTCIPEAMWLYDYGRFSSYYLVNGSFAKVLPSYTSLVADK
jgi:hypothetical protein